MAAERKIHEIDAAHKRSVELRRKLDEKRGVKKVTIGETTTGEPISNWDQKKNNWILGRI